MKQKTLRQKAHISILIAVINPFSINDISASEMVMSINLLALTEHKLLPSSSQSELKDDRIKNSILPSKLSRQSMRNTDEDSFGYSVSADGSRAIVGAVYDTENNIRSGSAYIYKFQNNSWVIEQKLLPSDPNNSEFFGYDVSLNGDMAAISSLGDIDRFPFVGSVFIFEYKNGFWIETHKIVGESLLEMGFGRSVMLSGNLLLIGDDNAFVNNNDTGAAYLYELVGQQWNLIHTFSSLKANNEFGFDVRFNQNLVLIGSEYQNEAFVFEKIAGQWQETQRLVPNDLGSFDEFGRVVDIHQNQIFVSARRTDIEIGAVYVFEKNKQGIWFEVQKITPSDGVPTDYFGWSFGVDSNQLLVGSPSSSGEKTSETGNVYLFEKSNNQWIEIEKISASDGDFIDHFGQAITVTGPLLFVGATGDDDAGIDSGSVYVFDRTVNLIFKDDFEQP